MDHLSTYEKLFKNAKHPEDVFSVSIKTPQELNDFWREMVAVIHPDRHTSEVAKTKAEELVQTLSQWKMKALDKIKVGTWGNKNSFKAVTLKSKEGEYVAKDRLASGDLCEVYTGEFSISGGSGECLIKVCKDPMNNDLVKNEAKIASLLKERASDLKAYTYHIPKLLDSFTLGDDMKRQVNIFDFHPGFCSLQHVMEENPDGIDPRDAAWMMNRAMAAMIAFEKANILHLGLVPSNILIHPEDHNGAVIDFSYAVENGGGNRPKAIVSRYKSYYPPEIWDKKAGVDGRPSLGFDTDLFILAKTFEGLLGDGPGVDEIKQFLGTCFYVNRNRRPDCVTSLHSDFDDLLRRLYGKRAFRPFAIKPPTRPQ